MIRDAYETRIQNSDVFLIFRKPAMGHFHGKVGIIVPRCVQINMGLGEEQAVMGKTKT